MRATRRALHPARRPLHSARRPLHSARHLPHPAPHPLHPAHHPPAPHHITLHSSSLTDVLKGVAETTAGLATLLTHAFSTNGIASTIFDVLCNWLVGGATYLLRELGNAISSTTTPQIGAPFYARQLAVMAVVGGAIALPLVLVTTIQAVVQHDGSLLVRMVLVKLPTSLLFTGCIVQLIQLSLAAVDSVCGAMWHAAGVSSSEGLSHLAHFVAGLPHITGAIGSAVAAAVGGMVIVVAFVLWLELALRSASIEIATLFLPIVMVGLIWPVTSHWARRLGEVLAALVVSKLAIVAVLALSVAQLGSFSGLDAVVTGVALLLLATLAPYALFKLVPLMESGAISHLEGLARRPMSPASMIGGEAARTGSSWLLAHAGSFGGGGAGGTSAGGQQGAGPRRGGMPAGGFGDVGDGGDAGIGDPGAAAASTPGSVGFMAGTPPPETFREDVAARARTLKPHPNWPSAGASASGDDGGN